MSPLEQWARERPEGIAYRMVPSGHAVSWRELELRSRKLSAAMVQAGLRAGDGIALMLENHLRYFEILWAAHRIGLYYTPISRHLKTEEMSHIVRDCGAKMLLCSAQTLAELDAEALRNSAGRELFTNPAKTLAERMLGSDVVLAADTQATLALARHGSATMLRLAGEVVAAAGLVDVLAALGSRATRSAGDRALFHDEEIDGPLPRRMWTFVLSTHAERSTVASRVGGFDDIAVIGAEDVPDLAGTGLPAGRPEQQLAILAVRLEMTAVYLKLVRG